MTTFDNISRVHFNTDEAETFAFKRFILTFQCVIADSFKGIYFILKELYPLFQKHGEEESQTIFSLKIVAY